MQVNKQLKNNLPTIDPIFDMKIEDEDLEILLAKVKKIETTKSQTLKNLNLPVEQLDATLK